MQNFSFCVAGCLHFGALMRDWNSYKDTYGLLSHVASLKPDLMIFNGSEVDLALKNSDLHNFKNNVSILKINVEPYIQYTRQLFDNMVCNISKNIYYLPSENSVPNFLGKNDPVFTIANQEFLKRAPGRYYSFEQHNCLFICLDSESDPGARGKISGEQLDFLENICKKAKDYKHCFCFIHLSAWRNSHKKEAEWFTKVHPVLKEAGVSHVFGACLHSYQHELHDGIHYIASGSCGNNLDPPFSHFLYVCIDGRGVNVNVVAVGFPLLLPMEMQLDPQLLVAFIDKPPVLKTKNNPSEIEMYNQAIELFLSGKIEAAQEIWYQIKCFPDFNAEKANRIVPDGTRNLWYIKGENEAAVKNTQKRFFV